MDTVYTGSRCKIGKPRTHAELTRETQFALLAKEAMMGKSLTAAIIFSIPMKAITPGLSGSPDSFMNVFPSSKRPSCMRCSTMTYKKCINENVHWKIAFVLLERELPEAISEVSLVAHVQWIVRV